MERKREEKEIERKHRISHVDTEKIFNRSLSHNRVKKVFFFFFPSSIIQSVKLLTSHSATLRGRRRRRARLRRGRRQLRLLLHSILRKRLFYETLMSRIATANRRRTRSVTRRVPLTSARGRRRTVLAGTTDGGAWGRAVDRIGRERASSSSTLSARRAKGNGRRGRGSGYACRRRRTRRRWWGRGRRRNSSRRSHLHEREGEKGIKRRKRIRVSVCVQGIRKRAFGDKELV